MGMVLKHQLTACYAAGSLGGTLGRLNESFRRLSRAHCTGSREKPAVAANPFFKTAQLAHLNQTTRLMADIWLSAMAGNRHIGQINRLFDSLKENVLGNLGRKRVRLNRYSDYQSLAQTLDNLKALDQGWM